MEAHDSSELPKPWEPSGVDVEPYAADAHIGAPEWERDVEVIASEPDEASAHHDFANRDPACAPAPAANGQRPDPQERIAVEAGRLPEICRPDRSAGWNVRWEEEIALRGMEAEEDRIGGIDAGMGGKALQNVGNEIGFHKERAGFEGGGDSEAAENGEEEIEAGGAGRFAQQGRIGCGFRRFCRGLSRGGG
jgi:hypothetical protein